MIKCPECFNEIHTSIRCTVCNHIFILESKKQLWTFKEFKENLLIVNTCNKNNLYSWDIEESELQKIIKYFEKRYGMNSKSMDIFLKQIENTIHASIFFYYEFYEYVLFFNSMYSDRKKTNTEYFVNRMTESLYYKYLEQFAWEREV